MEATKRSYLKPEVERFEMKMEAEFLAASSITFEPEKPDENWMDGIIEPQCTQNGTATSLPIGGQTCFTVNHADLKSCGLFFNLGVTPKTDIIKLTRISQTQYRAEKTDRLCETTSVEL